MRAYIRSPGTHCPCCGGDGQMEFIEIPESERRFTDTDGEKITEFLPETRDYSCRNCGCEFTLTQHGG